MPKEFLFAFKAPVGDGKRQRAAEEICAELRKQDTLTIPFAETDQIRQFAEIGMS